VTQTAPFDWARVIDYAKREQVEYPKTQYELPGVTIEEHGDDAVPVVVPPLWHAVVTARLNLPREDGQALERAQQRLNVALEEVENVYPSIADEIDTLWQDLPRTSGRRSAKTLAKSDNLRVTGHL
jgi:hypothetical protein